MLDRDRFVKDFIRQLFWAQTTDFDTTAFETEENKEIVNRAIDIARQQLPRHLIHNEKSIWQRCVLLFRMGAYHFYKNWC